MDLTSNKSVLHLRLEQNFVKAPGAQAWYGGTRIGSAKARQRPFWFRVFFSSWAESGLAYRLRSSAEVLG